MDAEDEDHDQGHGHDDRLDQARNRGGEEAAHGAVADDNGGGDQHRAHVTHVKQVGEELAAGGEAGGRVGHEEDDDDQGRDAFDQTALVAEAVGEEIGDRDRAELCRVAAQAPCDDKPVEIGADGKADHRPCRVRQAAEVGQTGNAHQEPAAHVGGLGAHRDDHGAELAAAEIEIAGGLVALGVGSADQKHTAEVYNDGNQNADIGECHKKYPSFLWKMLKV